MQQLGILDVFLQSYITGMELLKSKTQMVHSGGRI